MEDLSVKTREPRVVIDNTYLLASTGCRIMHFAPLIKDGKVIQQGITVAYKPLNKRLVEVATAVCHRKDRFVKKVGTQTAVQLWLQGNSIVLPLRPGQRAQDAVQDFFEPLTDDHVEISVTSFR